MQFVQVTETVTLTHTLCLVSVSEGTKLKMSKTVMANALTELIEALLFLCYISRNIRQIADLCSNVSHMQIFKQVASCSCPINVINTMNMQIRTLI